MKVFVVDTNVILVANNAHPDVSPECVIACVNRLEELMANGAIAVDDCHRIVGEYQNKTSHRNGKGAGDVFLKWVLSRLRDGSRVHQVPLTEVAENTFSEFPTSALEENFDPSDRKFAAVAHAHPSRPPIWQATDCKWLDWWPGLQKNGIEVEFLCLDDVCQFYKNKFPTRSVPNLP